LPGSTSDRGGPGERFAPRRQDRLRHVPVFLLNRLGQPDSTVVVPPLTGVDAGVVDVGNNRVLVIAEDPIFTAPGLPLEFFGWATVHIGASDIAVMGIKPRYMTYTLLMPPGPSDADFRIIVDSVHRAADELGIAIVGGHTGHYSGFGAPTVGGVTVFSVCGRNEYVTPMGARPGDDVILTKGLAIEAAAALSALREGELAGKYPSDLIAKAKNLCWQMTVVKDAATAMSAGGVTAMHDATEGGVIGGLFEIASASNVGMEVDESLCLYPDEVRMVCEAFGIDPVEAIAEGTLLITANANASGRIAAQLKQAGIPASVIGTVTADPARKVMRRQEGSVVSLAIPKQDPFWPAFFAGLAAAGRTEW